MVLENQTELDLTPLFEALDSRSRAILWHLWWHRHAQISELRSLTDASSDCEVLFRLKEVINGKAQELWDRRIVSFEESKTDPFIGEKVLFSWWLLDGEGISMTGRDTPLVDVFEDKDNVTIIAQLPGWAGPAQRRTERGTLEVKIKNVKCRNGVLQISLEKGRR